MTRLSEDDLETKVLKNYYSDNELFLSPEWLLKVAAILVSVASAALFLSGGCGGASGAVVALVCGAASALLCVAAALHLPSRAPRVWLLADLIISTVMGLLLLVSAILSMVFCEMTSVPAYLHGPLGITNAVLVTASGVATYSAVTRRLDAAQPNWEPQRPAPLDQEV